MTDAIDLHSCPPDELAKWLLINRFEVSDKLYMAIHHYLYFLQWLLEICCLVLFPDLCYIAMFVSIFNFKQLR